MKRIRVAIALLLICVTIALTEMYIVKSKADNLLTLVETSKVHYSNKEFTSSIKTLDTAAEKWTKNEKTLNIFLSHEKVDEIEESLSELNEYAKNKDNTLFFATFEKTIRQLLCLKQSELPNFENIL